MFVLIEKYQSRKVLRLLKQHFVQCKQSRAAATSLDGKLKATSTPKVDALYDKYKEDIMFSSYYDSGKVKLGYFRYHINALRKQKKLEGKRYEQKCLEPLPLALQYVVGEERLLLEDARGQEQDVEHKTFHLPHKAHKVTYDESTTEVHVEQWMSDYEHYDESSDKLCGDESDGEDVGHVQWSALYGTPDPGATVSAVQCGGCGALLHANDPAIPGYLPMQIFNGRSTEELRGMQCQRCHFLKEYNIALDISVQPHEYEKLLTSIKHVKSLVVMMVDLLDVPCSMWDGIVDIIGTQRPLFIVGNKVDLLPGDSIGYLKRIKESLMVEINKTRLKDANIKHVSLISAKNGYGVEGLINDMFKLWLYKGDVFLVGCTNVGKSSLFNALLQSDYCKVQAADVMQRATVSRWPGTTLNLLKFPINRPTGWKIYERTRRLNIQRKLLKDERKLSESQIKGEEAPMRPSLIGHIGRTFQDMRKFEEGHVPQEFGLNHRDATLARSRWFYDTPGVIHHDQTLSLLTTQELLCTVPKQYIKPQTYYLHSGSTILIGGLARIDFIHCTEACRFTVFCSDALPITIVKSSSAHEIYDTFLGTEMFAVPMGDKQRLDNWPGLKRHECELEFHGEGPKKCCGDVVLASFGWVAVTAKVGSVCTVHAWTPEARGIHVRRPSLLPFAINLKGDRVQGTPAYRIGGPFVDEEQNETS